MIRETTSSSLTSSPSRRSDLDRNSGILSADTEPGTDTARDEASASMFADHKGKLAIGAATMLGLAIFYKWREHKLAKDDPEEYERFRRIKNVVESEDVSTRRES